jgi:hypothetical protein
MKHNRCSRQPGSTVLLTAVASLTSVAFLGLLAPSSSLADGGFVGPYGAPIWEPAQKGLILWDQEAGREDLILQVDFEGETKDFGWIVPVPSLPELASADAGIFRDLSDLTRPIYRNRGRAWGCMDAEYGVKRPGGVEQDDIVIYDEQVVGIYQTLTLGAENAGPLLDSLQTWGYLHETNHETVEQTLQFYIDKSWYFVAMKMDSSSAMEMDHNGYWYGGIEPIRFSFDAAEPVYPLRISAISARNPSEILLYVCAPQRMNFPEATTQYANDLNAEEYAYIKEHYRHFGPLLEQPCFITKLRETRWIESMDDDIILEPAATNEEYRPIYDYSSLPGEPLLLAMTGIFLIGWAGLQRRKRNAA